jgi:hypothetical protein
VADHGIEADNDQDVPDREPRSFPKIFNATFVGNQAVEGGEGRAARLRRGTAGLIRNAIFVGFPGASIRGTVAGTWMQAEQGNLASTSSLIYGNGNRPGRRQHHRPAGHRGSRTPPRATASSTRCW